MAVGAAALLTALVPPAAASHAAEVADNLTCEGVGITLTFAQPVTTTATPNSFSAAGTVGTCYSQSGTHSNIDHGTMAAEGSGTFDCVSPHTFTGRATFTWFDRNNNPLGTTAVSYQGGERGSPGSDELSNREVGTTDGTSTLLPLNTFQGNFEPTGFTGSCTKTGITAETGDYAVDFSLLPLRQRSVPADLQHGRR